ncbi:putative cyclic nucleotide-gated ion channel 17 [Triticum urartu]|uniref:Putative cyclic nucleotide-gated ion channel 17 n=1 Tax=Triticum urartu TaxID=4572 RepID=M7Y6T8_TRIUA|nr:cyclic nucleotide-gated ion channel 17-like [Triticum urartu]EMS45588.1 putative cyclic nucleotide-gated ion channel 17 [Triticum urartu]
MEYAMFGSRRVDDDTGFRRQRTVRFREERTKATMPIHQKQAGPAARKLGVGNWGKNRIFVAGQDLPHKRIIDPTSDFILLWNYVFRVSCFVALFMDPLYFYVPKIVYGKTSCVGKDRHLAIIITVFRSIADLFYVIQIVIKFMTAYINPSSKSGVFGRGELVTDPNEIAKTYLRSDFVVDLVASIPVPQIITWSVIPAIKYTWSGHNNDILFLAALFQYILRLYLIFSLNSKILKVTGAFSKTAWQGAVSNLLLYMTASHVLGALWYLLSVDRQTACWQKYCNKEDGCHNKYLSCNAKPDPNWAKSSTIFDACNASNKTLTTFDFGMFGTLLSNKAPGHRFLKKYLYCLWWGLQNLSCYGQTLGVSTYIGETLYAIFLAVLGLVLFAHLIGNVQTYLQSITARVEEWRVKQRDTEEWMKHRQLPPVLRERVRRFIHYKWLATRGVDEASILKALPADLRRDINRHLCLDLVRRVPFFSQMDDQLLDAICGRLVSSLSTKGTYTVREGDPVTEMLFIIRGKLESSTTDGGRTGFFNSIILKSGDFCGEELLGWALVPRPTVNLPSSTRTVKALVEVEAFALQAEDLRFVASQFRRLHSRKLQHTFRYYSHHWRTWAACFIQATWRRHKRRRLARDLMMRESFSSMRSYEDGDGGGSFAEHRRSVKIMAAARKGSDGHRELPKFRKPSEPDFSVEHDD